MYTYKNLVLGRLINQVGLLSFLALINQPLEILFLTDATLRFYYTILLNYYDT